MAHGPGAAFPVDELESPGSQVPEGGIDIVHAEGDMVEAGAPLLQEPANGGIRGQWLQELQLSVAGSHEDQLDALGRNALAAGTSGACDGFEHRKHAVDGLDGYGDVVEGQALEARKVRFHYVCLGRRFSALKDMANVYPGMGPGNRTFE